MTRGARRPPEHEIEQALERLASHVAFPPTPDFRATVRSAIEAAPRRRGSLGSMLHARPLRAVAVLALSALLAVLAASPSVRASVVEWLDGIPGVELVVGSDPPAAAGGLRLGESTTLEDARAAVPFELLLPRDQGVGAPDEVYRREGAAGGQVSLLYRRRRGWPIAPETGVSLLLTEFRGIVGEPALVKALGRGAHVERVEVNGAAGWWLAGAPHSVSFRDAAGRPARSRARLAANTLIWQRGELVLRLESALPKERAIQLARSVR